MIVAGLLARRPSLLAHPDWSAINNVKSNDDNSTFALEQAQIFDILAQLPTLYYKQDIITLSSAAESANTATSSKRKSSLSDLQSILGQALILLDKIKGKMKQWKVSYPDTEYTAFPCRIVPSVQPYPCTVVTHFSSRYRAYLSTLYNSTIILINQFIVSINWFLPDTPTSASLIISASEQISAAVMEIIQSIDYELEYIGKTARDSFYLFFPIRTACQALTKSTSAESLSQKLWLEDVHTLIANRAGAWTYSKTIFGVESIGCINTPENMVSLRW